MSNASLISGDYSVDKLTADLLNVNFIEFGGYDWAWASPVHSEEWGTNTLYQPDLHSGWKYASFDELMDFRIFFMENGLDLFKLKNAEGENVIIDGQQQYIQAVSFWNDSFDNILLEETVEGPDGEMIANPNLSTDNFLNGFIASDPADDVKYDTDIFGELDHWETFYVRDVEDRPDAEPVPEPTTLLIFAIGLIALSLRARSS